MILTYPEIEQALRDLYSGIDVTTFRNETSESVMAEVYVDDPDSEEEDEKTYPCIVIRHLSEHPAPETFESDSTYTESVDTTQSPAVSTNRKRPEFTWNHFHVYTYATNAATDRELLFAARSKLRRLDSMLVGSEWCWTKSTGSTRQDYEIHDEKVYRSIWTVSILAAIDNSQTEYTAKRVTSVELNIEDNSGVEESVTTSEED